MAEGVLSGLESLSLDYSKGDPACLASLAKSLDELRTFALSEGGSDDLAGHLVVPRLVNIFPLLASHTPELYGLGKGGTGHVDLSEGFQVQLESEFSSQDKATPDPLSPETKAVLQNAAVRPLVGALKALQILLAKSSACRMSFLQEGGLDVVATIADRLCTAAVIKHRGGDPAPGTPTTAPGGGAATAVGQAGPAGTGTGPAKPPLAGPGTAPVPGAAGLAPIPNRKNKSVNRLRASTLNLAVAPSPTPLSSFLAQSGVGFSPSPMSSAALKHFQNKPPPSPSMASLPVQVTLPEDHLLAVAKVMQVLGNFCQGGETYQRATLDRCFPGTFARAAATQSWTVLSPLCMVLYTCSRGSPAMAKVLGCTADGVSLLASLLRAETPKIFQSKEVFPLPVGPGESERGMDEWLSLLLHLLCIDLAYSLPIFKNIVNHSPKRALEGPGPWPFCPEQAAMLWVLWGSLYDNARRRDALPAGMPGLEPPASGDGGARPDVDRTRGTSSGGLRNPILTNVDAFDFLVTTARTAAAVVAREGHAPGEPPADVPAGVLRFSLQILRILAVEAGSSPYIKGERVSTAPLWSDLVIPLVLDMLRALGPPPRAAGKGPAVEAPQEQAETALGKFPAKLPYEGYRRDLVAIIGNACFHREANQNAVRSHNGLLLILQQCVVDDQNPLLKEWGIWAIRNLLEGNEENQKVVSGLEILGGAESLELKDMGLKVVVDPTTKQAKLQNIGAGEG